MKIAFLKLLRTEDLKTPLKNVKKMKTMLCAGSPKSYVIELLYRKDYFTITSPNKLLILDSLFLEDSSII